MQRYVCALSTVSLYKYTTDKPPLDQLTGALARARVRSLAPARSPLYRYFCSGLSFLSGAPLLHPTMVYLKCHGGEGVHAHAHAQCSERCWPTGWLRALHRPCCQTAYVYVQRACMCTRACAYRKPAGTQVCARAHTHAHARTHSTAILRRSANQWRNCKPVHPRGPPVVHAAWWISNLLRIFVFLPFFSFHSIAFHRFTDCPQLRA